MFQQQTDTERSHARTHWFVKPAIATGIAGLLLTADIPSGANACPAPGCFVARQADFPTLTDVPVQDSNWYADYQPSGFVARNNNTGTNFAVSGNVAG